MKTHTLLTGPGITAAEVAASMLAFACARGGSLAPGVMRGERDELAGLVESPALAALLRSDSPIRVEWVGYEVYEVEGL